MALLTTGLSAESPALIFGLGGLGLAITLWAFIRLVPPGTLRAARGYPTAILLRGLVTFAFFSIDAYVALLLVEVRGWSAAGAGIALTAATVSWTAGSWTQARLSERISHERFVRVGFPVVAIGIAGLGLILIPEVPGLARRADLRARRVRDGPHLRPVRAHRAARRPARLPGRGHGGADAVGRARDGASGRASRRRSSRPSVRAGLGPAPGLAAAIVAGTAARDRRLGAGASPPAESRARLGPRPARRASSPRGGPTFVSAEELRAKIREVPDFPKPGILFYDITTLLKDAAAYRESIRLMLEPYRGDQLDIVIGMESRGFIFSAPMAYELGAGFVPVRKLGKLPAETISVEYALEYGSNTLEIHRDAIEPGQKVLIVDDLLATGGTVQGTIELVERLKGEVVGLAFLVELEFLHGRDRLPDRRVTSVIRY